MSRAIHPLCAAPAAVAASPAPVFAQPIAATGIIDCVTPAARLFAPGTGLAAHAGTRHRL